MGQWWRAGTLALGLELERESSGLARLLLDWMEVVGGPVLYGVIGSVG